MYTFWILTTQQDYSIVVENPKHFVKKHASWAMLLKFFKTFDQAHPPLFDFLVQVIWLFSHCIQCNLTWIVLFTFIFIFSIFLLFLSLIFYNSFNLITEMKRDVRVKVSVWVSLPFNSQLLASYFFFGRIVTLATWVPGKSM